MKAFWLYRNFFFLSGIMLVFLNCSSSQVFQKNPPFKINEVYSEEWVNGTQGGGYGVNIHAYLFEIAENVVIDSLFYDGMGTKLEEQKVDKGLYFLAWYLKENYKKPDLIMHEDPKKEVGNTVPVTHKKIPFELEKDEAVISYIENGNKNYYKIKGIKKKPAVHYP
ncbi:hypothetical protein [Leptobacterium sp. I13]|uniref:hypothetical protein n=1 Tax=Leptobacterium meishanense TaxID=3128904 RepID=UPI0030EED914